MSKRKLFKFLGNSIKISWPKILKTNKTVLGIRAGEQIKRLGNLGQELITMRMG